MHPCPSCARHVRGSETTCPFCEAALPERASDVRAAAPFTRAVSRAAIVFGAAAIGACGKAQKVEDQPVAVYGPPPMAIEASVPPTIVDDASAPGAAKDGAK
jgi:hypothetical protein